MQKLPTKTEKNMNLKFGHTESYVSLLNDFQNIPLFWQYYKSNADKQVTESGYDIEFNLARK